MSTMTIELPGALKAKVAKTARQLGLTPTVFVREVLETRLKNGGAAAKPSLYDLSHDLCGRLSGGTIGRSREKAALKGYGQWKR